MFQIIPRARRVAGLALILPCAALLVALAGCKSGPPPGAQVSNGPTGTADPNRQATMQREIARRRGGGGSGGGMNPNQAKSMEQYRNRGR
jgi:hypothetical protein